MNLLQDPIPGSVHVLKKGIWTAGHCPEPMSYKAELKGLGINLLDLGEWATTELYQAKIHALVEPGKRGCW